MTGLASSFARRLNRLIGRVGGGRVFDHPTTDARSQRSTHSSARSTTCTRTGRSPVTPPGARAAMTRSHLPASTLASSRARAPGSARRWVQCDEPPPNELRPVRS
jgi:hypothetical protein